MLGWSEKERVLKKNYLFSKKRRVTIKVVNLHKVKCNMYLIVLFQAISMEFTKRQCASVMGTVESPTGSVMANWFFLT